MFVCSCRQAIWCWDHCEELWCSFREQRFDLLLKLTSFLARLKLLFKGGNLVRFSLCQFDFFFKQTVLSTLLYDTFFTGSFPLPFICSDKGKPGLVRWVELAGSTGSLRLPL